jgi:hypothetical protein
LPGSGGAYLDRMFCCGYGACLLAMQFSCVCVGIFGLLSSLWARFCSLLCLVLASCALVNGNGLQNSDCGLGTRMHRTLGYLTSKGSRRKVTRKELYDFLTRLSSENYTGINPLYMSLLLPQMQAVMQLEPGNLTELNLLATFLLLFSSDSLIFLILSSPGCSGVAIGNKNSQHPNPP